MGDLVADRRSAAYSLRQRGRLAPDERLLVVEDRAGMLHAAEGEGGCEQEVEVLGAVELARVARRRHRAPWVWNAEVRREPLLRALVERDQGVRVHLLRA